MHEINEAGIRQFEDLMNLKEEDRSAMVAFFYKKT